MKRTSKATAALAYCLLVIGIDGRQTKSPSRLTRTRSGLPKKARSLSDMYPPEENYLYGSLPGASDIGNENFEVDGNWQTRKHKTQKSCKSAGSNSRPTCVPSLAPSPAPTVSLAPSPTPSSTPTKSPTATPSANPTPAPTISSAPSPSPSRSPTKAPTDQPSPVPSATPTESPTYTPSSQPSLLPTLTPSDPPSTVPTMDPTLSMMPTLTPSQSPSLAPSPSPSMAPSISIAPTIRLVATATSDGLESTCIYPPPGRGTTQEQTLAFQYNLYMAPAANSADANFAMESALHSGMTKNFLECDFDTSKSFYILAVKSKPDDTISNDACDMSTDPMSDGAICVVVNAELTMTAYFPSTRRELQTTDANSDVLEASSEYLKNSMADGDFVGGEIVQVSFRGFVNVNSARETPPASGGGSGIAGIVGGESFQPSNENSNIGVGSAVVAIAGVCFILVTILAVRYRQGRQDAYLHHLEDLSVISDLSYGMEKGQLLGDGKVRLVTHDLSDLDSLDEVMNEPAEEERRQHDVRNCASATCAVCRDRELNPTFISTSNLGVDAIADLRQQASVLDARRPGSSIPDTVAL